MATRVHAAAGTQERRSLSVAVVGGGATGLAAAKELLAAGHAPTVYESSTEVGGIWQYREATDDHPLGLGGQAQYASMYAGLRTNLPREVMGYLDFPFDQSFPGSADARRFCGHEEVQRYLLAFAEAFHLRPHVQFGTEVARVAPVPAAAGGTAWPRWEVTTRPAGEQAAAAAAAGSGGGSTQLYDAIMVCNGHYSRPRLPALPGQDVFPGQQLHSHNYRRPEGFKGQTVVLLGASSSGVDIAEEIMQAGAARVVVCARVWENPLTGEVLSIDSRVIQGSALAGAEPTAAAGDAQGGSVPPGMAAALSPSIIKAPMIAELRADGSVALVDGTVIEGVDALMYSTGYHYDLPFLEGATLGGRPLVTVDDNRVGPLYQHVFPPAAAPTLSFIGLPWKVVPFPQVELQSRWVAYVLSGAAALPPRADMEAHAAAFYASLAAAGTAQRYTHRMAGSLQWDYSRWLAQQCGEAEAEAVAGSLAWREQLYSACGNSRKLNAASYRDAPLVGADEALAAAAEEAARVRQRLAAAVATA